MNLHSIESLMADIEEEDPLDLGDLAIDETEARRLMASHFCEIDERLSEHGLDAEARLEIMAAIAAHTMTENMILHLGRLRASSGDDFHAWMRRHGIG
ncbi:hypothetical protein [Azoarcus olearius]|uniref:Uncharacterized protein n=1 Tax=Azoarcus sp. (strain BH72) TaxID=418699 RepID=A1K4X7_AZOSB|nr:hypothetical protein [Azoarcus olearius]ANQ84433.1 hypothetical protein dqs_1380 [Azoarcus olearius]CAL93882.1 Hypothetical protein azo1265 [Azoarcus olearius]